MSDGSGWNGAQAPAATRWPDGAWQVGPVPAGEASWGSSAGWGPAPVPQPQPVSAPTRTDRPGGAVRVVSGTAAAFSLLPTLFLVTNGATLLAMLSKFENTPASMLIPPMSAVGWCLTIGGAVHAVAAVTEVVLAWRKSLSLLFVSIVAVAGAVLAGVGAVLYGQEIEQLNHMFGAGQQMAAAIREGRTATALMAALAVTALLCHIPGISYGIRLRRHHTRALQAWYAAQEAQTSAQERAERERLAAQQPPSYGQLPYGALSQPYEGRR